MTLGTALADRIDSKTAAIVAARARPDPGEKVTEFRKAREVLRSAAMKQAGGGAEYFDISDPARAPVFFLDGAEHKKKRAAIARFFAPRTITTRYAEIIDRVIAEQLDAFRRAGTANIDAMSFDLAVAVAGDIVGLTVTDRKKMARRLDMSLSSAFFPRGDVIGRMRVKLQKLFNSIDFFYNDVKPAIRDRTANPRDDLLSHLIQIGCSQKAILMECMTYAAAGMVTTREFITMAAWHMFDDPELRARFMEGDEEVQFAILLEILRLEPIAAFLYRSDAEGSVHTLCLRDANLDESVVGACPHALDPDRAAKMKTNGSFLSFGDGPHHCPGWQVALHEARAFLHAMFSVPGIKLERAPDISWNEMLQSYELRKAVVSCDPA